MMSARVNEKRAIIEMANILCDVFQTEHRFCTRQAHEIITTMTMIIQQ